MTSCDRCNTELGGRGVIHGALLTDSTDTGETVDRILCYICRDPVLNGLLLHPGLADCSTCGVSIGVRTPAVAMLCSDLDPANPDQVRQSAFCHAGGCRERVLARI